MGSPLGLEFGRQAQTSVASTFRDINREQRVTSMTDSNESQSVWDSAFSKETQSELLKDDSEAWAAVTGLLLAIITVGLTLAVITAWMCY